MKPLLIASVALNLALAGSIGYLLGTRSTTVPAENFAASSAPPAIPSSAPATPATAATVESLPPPPPPSVSGLSQFPPSAAAASIEPPPPVLTSHLSGEGVDFHARATSRTATPDAQPVSAAAPGNSLDFHGIRVAVAEAYLNGNAGTALAVDVTPSVSAPDETAGSEAGDSSSTTSNIRTALRDNSPTATNAQPAATPVNTAQAQSGDMTREDELFRMKWGWEAFDAARTEARREAERKKLSQ